MYDDANQFLLYKMNESHGCRLFVLRMFASTQNLISGILANKNYAELPLVLD
jgi:hypothetical protein